MFNEAVNAGVLLWARRELRRRWGTLLLLAVLIAIGGGASVAAAAAARRTDTAFDRMLLATHQPNLTVLGSNDQGFFDLDPALLDRVMQIPGVKGVTQYAFVAVSPESVRANYFALAIIDRRGEASQPIWIDGTRVDDIGALRPDDVLLNEAMRNQLGKGPGETITLKSLTPEQFQASLNQDSSIAPAGPTLNARIAGVGRTPEDVSDAPDPFLLLSPAFYQKYHDAVGGCICNLSITAAPDSVDAVTAALRTIYPNAEIQPAEDLAARIRDTVGLQRRAWWLISLAAAVAGVVALLQTGNRAGRILLTGDDVRRSLGMTRHERRLCRLLVIVPPVILGATVALGIAYLLSPLAPVGLTKLAEPTPGLRWDPGVLIPGVLLVLVVSLVVTGTTTVAMRPRAERRRSPGAFSSPELAFGSRLAFGPGRGAIVGVVLATAGLVGAFTLEHSIDKVLATPALYGADFDASNLLDSAQDKRALGEQLTSDTDVEAVGLLWTRLPSAPALHVVGPSASADVNVDAVESIKGTVSVRQTRGRVPARPDEVAVGRAVMDQLGANIGDRISAMGTDGPVELTIVGDNLDPGVDVAGNGFTMTADGLSALVGATIQGVLVRFAPGSNHAAVIDRYKALGFTAMTPPSEVGHIGQLGGLPGRFGQLLTLLGVAALLNAIVLTARSARREIALHRALGFTSAQVIAVHLWQFVITAVTGIVIGGSVGFIVGRAIDRHLIGNVGAIAETVLPRQVWATAVGVVVVCLAAAAITGGLSLRRRPGRELRTE
ncbi:MAG: putative transport system permease protein [Ilumatobacteraceae bacterium]|nr:putative transport system permease protein [Ilumatobacteraceae bacterium]